MWLIFGISAIITTILNIIFAATNKTNKWLGFSSLSLTALTVCSFYSDAASRVVQEDWSALLDILPTTSITLWICVFASIILNSIPLFIKKKEDKDKDKNQ